MPSAEFTYIDTPPVVEGGSYERELADGRIETGTVMGTKVDDRGRLCGWYYSFIMGPVPHKIVEGTATMQGLKLVAAPSKQTGKTLAGIHKAKLKETAEAA